MTKPFGVFAFVVAVGFAGLAGCGSSGGMFPTGGTGTGGGGGTSGTGSGVTGTKRLDSLTTSEKQAICDWAAMEFGGYGHVMDCGGGTTITAEPDQATCVADAPTNCAATVTQYEACITQVSCSNLAPAACGPVFTNCM